MPVLNETLEEGQGEYEVVALFTADQVSAILSVMSNGVFPLRPAPLRAGKHQKP